MKDPGQSTAACELDRRPIKARSSRWACAVTRALASLGISPNTISVFGMIAAIAAGISFYFTRFDCGFERGFWIGGAVLVFLRLMANMFDGMVAVERGKATRVGALYNEVPDRVSDAAVLIGAGYAAGGSVELGYLAACVALFVAFVRSMVKTAGAPSDFGGPMAKQQRMFLVIATAIYLCVTPGTWHFNWGPQQEWGPMALALALVVLGGALTAALRLRRAAQALRQS
jgi:phosphatidylglycerophosphate synthase